MEKLIGYKFHSIVLGNEENGKKNEVEVYITYGKIL